MLSSITHQKNSPNLFEFLFTVEQKIIYFKEFGNQTVDYNH